MFQRQNALLQSLKEPLLPEATPVLREIVISNPGLYLTALPDDLIRSIYSMMAEISPRELIMLSRLNKALQSHLSLRLKSWAGFTMKHEALQQHDQLDSRMATQKNRLFKMVDELGHSLVIEKILFDNGSNIQVRAQIALLQQQLDTYTQNVIGTTMRRQAENTKVILILFGLCVVFTALSGFFTGARMDHDNFGGEQSLAFMGAEMGLPVTAGLVYCLYRYHLSSKLHIDASRCQTLLTSMEATQQGIEELQEDVVLQNSNLKIQDEIRQLTKSSRRGMGSAFFESQVAKGRQAIQEPVMEGQRRRMQRRHGHSAN